jgi:hypothetical protein
MSSVCLHVIKLTIIPSPHLTYLVNLTRYNLIAQRKRKKDLTVEGEELEVDPLEFLLSDVGVAVIISLRVSL